MKHTASQPPSPSYRQLRGYAFDPSVASQLETFAVSRILYKVPWEDLTHSSSGGSAPAVGPQGEYLEVVDYDPPSGCFYAPVNLNDPYILAQNGLSPSEGNPQFHQQMVYAVAMTVIDRFERALGRKAMWRDFSQLVRLEEEKERVRKVRKYRSESMSKPLSSSLPVESAQPAPSSDDSTKIEYYHRRFVQRLRIYPHALREANAYYSADKVALLFGYFPAALESTDGYPGGMVFTCLSHDIVAHETTHALLDGFHEELLVPTNMDVLAFHEAFADVVALFQHFSFPEQLRHQIAKTRGDLGSENLLAQLATQFGRASGSRGALRDFIGTYNDATGLWERHVPNPADLEHATKAHDRGAILVAAIFDAFLGIYRRRSRDLVRLATSGTGVLQPGELHPDLVNRLAAEASKSAGHILNICIRALDYCPPIDITFGEYLRALITADMDLVPDDSLGYRVAILEAFRRRGIFPNHIQTLSEDSLRWSPPGYELKGRIDEAAELKRNLASLLKKANIRRHAERLRACKTRYEIWKASDAICLDIYNKLIGLTGKDLELAQSVTKLKFRELREASDEVYSAMVYSFREARRLRDDGRILNQVFITILQTQQVAVPADDAAKDNTEAEKMPLRCGATLVVDLDEMCISYAIHKGPGDPTRIQRSRRAAKATGMASPYFEQSSETFAALHR